RGELPDEVAHEPEVASARHDHRHEVVPTDAREQVEQRAGLEELGAEARVRPEHEALLAVDHAKVEVRNRHRGRADGSLAVDLGSMLGDNLRVVGPEELATHREATEPANLLDARLLQQPQRVAATTHEHETGGD